MPPELKDGAATEALVGAVTTDNGAARDALAQQMLEHERRLLARRCQGSPGTGALV